MSSITTGNYYEQELARINFTGPTPATILVGSEGCVTKTLNLNAECAAALINKLVEVFLHPGMPKQEKEPEQKETPDFVFQGCMGRDRNGNKILRVFGTPGFSIQTNGNLPDTDRNGITHRTVDEVRAYVRRFGTKRQKQIYGV